MNVKRHRDAIRVGDATGVEPEFVLDFTAQEWRYILELVRVGLHGDNPAEVAHELIRRGLAAAYSDGLIGRRRA